MSLFGKILAVLNIVGAAAFLVVAFMDFAKREAWSYANHVHDVAVNGVAQDDKQLDYRGFPDKDNLAKETKNEWFPDAPISTQVEEVDRVKGQVDALLDKVKGDPLKHTTELSRILTPFATHYSERAWQLSVQTHLATPDAEAKLHQRLHDAFAPAVTACLTRPGLKFPQAFVEACRAQGGEPAPAFEQTFLNVLPDKVPPDKPQKTFDSALEAARNAPAPQAALVFLQALRDDAKPTGDKDPVDESLGKVYQTTLTTIHDQLKAQLDDLADQARNGVKSLDPKSTDRLRDYQRTAIAHYLFNMVEALNPDAALKGVVASPEYNRFVRVVGMNRAVQEINDQAAVLKTLADELQTEREKERTAFAIAHGVLIEGLKSQAVQLHNGDQLLADVTKELNKQTGVTTTQQTKVDKQEQELADARARTDGAMAELRDLSDALQKLRTERRDLLGKNLDLEKQIEELENKR